MKLELLAAAAATAALALSSTTVAADTAASTPCSANDLTALNYALTLEHLESAFYTKFQGQYTAADFTAAGYDQYVYPNFALIQAHEAAHVETLTSTISGRGGQPAPECVYNFTSIDSVAAYVAVAQVLENTGVTAYDGAINTFTDPALEQAAATIATVEARHAAYLNQLNKVTPFPAVFDNATAPDAVVKEVLATGLIVSCPYTLNTPIVLVPAAPAGTTSATAGSNAGPARTLSADESANDLKVLNYALTLEHLESHFYTQFQSQYTAADFATAGFSQAVFDEFNMIAAHEKAHVTALSTTISSLGGTPVPECVYNFTAVNNVTAYVATSKVLENTGVSAYDGAVNMISSTDLKQIAATIATVEARHAAVLNQLNGVAPFPDTLDTAKAPADIVAAVLATGFVVSCPYPLDTTTLPVLLSTAGDCNAKDTSTGAPAPASPATPAPTTPAPASGESNTTAPAAPTASGSGVCPSVTYNASYTRTADDFTVKFALDNNAASSTGVQWVDLHVSINTPFSVDPQTGAYITQFNYRMQQAAGNGVFTYSFPGTDGVRIPANQYVEYFFTYFTTFACNGEAGTLGATTDNAGASNGNVNGTVMSTTASKADSVTGTAINGATNAGVSVAMLLVLATGAVASMLGAAL